MHPLSFKCLLALFVWLSNRLFDNPADCEVHVVIRVLNAKNVHPTEIHQQLVEVYVDNVMNDGNMHKRCRLFNEGRTNVHYKDRSERQPTVIIEDLIKKVNDCIRETEQFTIDDLHLSFLHVS